MKNSTIIIILLLTAGVLYLLYRRYIYFPHARVIAVEPDGLVWTNNDNIIQTKLRRDCAGDTGGTYGNRFEYAIQCLPNKQFRFVVHKKGQPAARVVDNIFSFIAPPDYLTK